MSKRAFQFGHSRISCKKPRLIGDKMIDDGFRRIRPSYSNTIIGVDMIPDRILLILSHCISNGVRQTKNCADRRVRKKHENIVSDWLKTVVDENVMSKEIRIRLITSIDKNDLLRLGLGAVISGDIVLSNQVYGDQTESAEGNTYIDDNLLLDG
jgi:hypothetical protein